MSKSVERRIALMKKSDLENLGGLAKAEKWIKDPVYKEDEVGNQLEEGAAFVEALIAKVKELEQTCPNGHPASLIHCITEWVGPNSAQDAPDYVCEMCELETKLRSARELAEAVGEIDPEDTTVDGYVGIPVDRWIAIFSAATTFLEGLR